MSRVLRICGQGKTGLMQGAGYYFAGGPLFPSTSSLISKPASSI